MPERYHQPTLEEVESLGFAASLCFVVPNQWKVVNDSLAMAFSEDHRVLIMCDMRIRIEIMGIKKDLQNLVRIGTLPLAITENDLLFIGEEDPLVFKRVQPKEYFRKLSVCHSSFIDIDQAMKTSKHEIEMRLREELDPHTNSLERFYLNRTEF